ncbi:MAG: SGNH/GDSL hydrolase family protein [Actinobacteria bacterium]|nr:SGNH/GDSL hydrolase family protein [Actinomycetota bacterium]
MAFALVAASGCGRGGSDAAAPASTATVTSSTVDSTTQPPATSNSGSTGTTRGAASAPAVTSTTGRDPVVVGLGNSVPSGAACSCVNFVSAYAQMLAAGTSSKATVDNDAVSGSTSADVVNLLTKKTVQAHVRTATTVLIMTGANDFNDAFDAVSLGAPAASTFAPVATAVQDNVTAAVQKILALNPSIHVVVLDYWAAMEDGAVAARDYDPETMAASVASTNYVNDALAVAAKATGALYLSTYTAFKGPAGANDPTALLASDGDHPNAAGHQLIARTIYAALPKG